MAAQTFFQSPLFLSTKVFSHQLHHQRFFIAEMTLGQLLQLGRSGLQQVSDLLRAFGYRTLQQAIELIQQKLQPLMGQIYGFNFGGRNANPPLQFLEKIVVFGMMMPLQHVAEIAVPTQQCLQLAGIVLIYLLKLITQRSNITQQGPMSEECCFQQEGIAGALCIHRLAKLGRPEQ